MYFTHRRNFVLLLVLLAACSGTQQPKPKPPPSFAESTHFELPARPVTDPAPGCADSFRNAYQALEKAYEIRSATETLSTHCTAARSALEAAINTHCEGFKGPVMRGSLKIAFQCVSAAPDDMAKNMIASTVGVDTDRFVDAALAARPAVPQVAALPFAGEFVTALTDFVVSRAKQELFAYVADTLGTRLCSKRLDKVEVRSYFPSTCDLLVDADGNQQLGPEQIGRTLQAALSRDLRGLVPVAVGAVLARTDKLAGGQGRGIREIASALVAGEPLNEALEHAARTLPCDGAGDQRCVVPLMAAAGNAWLSNAPDLTKAAGAFSKRVKSSPKLAEYCGACKEVKQAETKVKSLKAAVDKLKNQLAQLRQRPRSLEHLSSMFTNVADLADLAIDAFAGGANKATLKNEIATMKAVWGRVESTWTAAASVLSIIEGLRQGQEPLGAMTQLASLLPCKTGKNMPCTLKVMAYVVRSVTETGGWSRVEPTDVEEVKTLLDRVNTKLLGYLSQDADTARWVSGAFPNGLRSSLGALFVEIRAVHQAVKAMAMEPDAGKQRVRLQRVAEASVSLARTALLVVGAQVDRNAADRLSRAAGEMLGAWQAGEARDYGRLIVHVLAIARELDAERPIPEPIRQYVPLVTAIASAESSTEMKAALEKYALPAGGWRLKRKTHPVVSLTAFVGFAGGYEELQPADSFLRGAATTTLFAPVGLDWSWGANGLFMSLVDVGTLTATRWGISDESIDTPELGIVQVFSPGLYLRRQVAGPITLGVGASGVPDLREEADVSQAAWRVLGFIGVDVTLMTFRTD